jgi:hypothetical protein
LIFTAAAKMKKPRQKLQCKLKCENSYLICELVQLFDPPYIAERSATINLVARLAETKPFGERPDLMARLQRDLPT